MGDLETKIVPTKVRMAILVEQFPQLLRTITMARQFPAAPAP